MRLSSLVIGSKDRFQMVIPEVHVAASSAQKWTFGHTVPLKANVKFATIFTVEIVFGKSRLL